MTRELLRAAEGERNGMVTRREFMQLGVSALIVARAGGAGGQTPKRRFRFFLWNDIHVRNPEVPDRPPPYPLANEKAQWAVECAQGKHGVEPPDFIMSAGDIIDGEIPDFGQDFAYLKEAVLDKLPVPFMPCLGNHENEQGEGIPEKYRAYDACFGEGRRNYVFTYRGMGFIVVDTSGGHRTPDEVTAVRNAFMEHAFAAFDGMPVFVVTHVPLVAFREEEVLTASFGWPSWRVLDPRMLEIVEAHRDSVVAVLSGHLHLSGMCIVNGITHVDVAGTAAYPCDYAEIDVFDDHVDVQLRSVPEEMRQRGGDTHGKPRHPIDYTDAEHKDYASYVMGNPDERSFVIPLEEAKRPKGEEPATITTKEVN